MTFETLRPQAPDAILALMAAFREDPREAKLDLGVGVYRDARGVTPVMRAVKAAERRLVEAQDTKAYVALAGDGAFCEALGTLVAGSVGGMATAATPGGTGAVHQGLELMRMARPDATVWLSDPTWPNHPAIAAHVGLATQSYRYLDRDAGAVAFDAMLEDLGGVAAGDAVVLHGCCHNPSGADLTAPQWEAVADLLARRGAVAFVDIAYQGFGEGLEADAAGVRTLLARVPEALVAVSCSKNFGLYRERVGLLMAKGGDRAVVQGALAALNRLNYSFPPDHGARVVQTILADAALRADWAAELEAMRSGVAGLRVALAEALRARTGSDRFGFLAGQRGMFSLLPAGPEQVEAMRRDHGVYAVADGRINVAGLSAATVPVLADAMVACGL